MDVRTRRRRFAALGLAAAVVAVSACRVPLPPITAVGDPIIGINPQTPGTPGAQTKAISYGPWTVPAATGAGHANAGMVTDVRFLIERPCTDCFITSAKPELKYRDGSIANTDTGLWLHHFAVLDSGSVDTQCGATAVRAVGEVFFTGANERTQGRFPAGTGYRTRPLNAWTMLVDFMNTTMEAKEVVFELTWEYVPASNPGMRHAKPVFIDASGMPCVDSTLPAQSGAYSYSGVWQVTVPGRILGAAGHAHDGGTHVILRNRTAGQDICNSVQHYGGPGFEEPEGSGHGHGHPTVHISGVDQCVARGIDKPVAVIKRGEILEVEAYYDQAAHPHPLDEEVMGLALMYILPEG